MSSDWCVLRTSLFRDDFSVQSASADELARFHAAIAVASSNRELSDQLRAGALPGVRALYEARVRSRSVPRSLFAAAAIATRDGDEPSLAHVEVQRCGGFDRPPGEPEPETLAVSSHAVFHADAVTAYRRDRSAGGFEAVRLGVPEPVCEVLLAHRVGTRAQWAERLRARGFAAEQAERLVTRLGGLGVLEAPPPCALWNDDAPPKTEGLGAAVRAIEAQAEPVAGNAFATFARPLRMPAALEQAQAVGEVLLRCARLGPATVPQILSRLLDGRWLPMPELERMAEGVLGTAGSTEFVVAPQDEPFVRWLRARALDPEIDLGEAPLPERTWSGALLMGTQWIDDDRLLDPTLFAVPPRELIARYALPGLPERLAALDDGETTTVALAYEGPGVLGEVAAVHMPGTLALEYCGAASARDRVLRLEDLEVAATATALHFRVRHDQRPVTLVRPIPYNDALPGLHPLVRLLSAAEGARRPVRSLIDAAFEGLPVRPRVTYQGHVLARRRARVPLDLRETELSSWRARVGLSGPASVGSSSGGLPLGEGPDDPVRLDLLKRLRRGERLVLSERLPARGLEIDGHAHAVHALVPITVASRAAAPAIPRVPRPLRPALLRGPFRTLRVHALAERMPTVLRRLRERLDGTPFFYVFLSDALESELRLRVPAQAQSLQQALTETLDLLLDRRIIRHWAVEPYVREWDRYGGAQDIEAVERLFVADSASFYEPCTSMSLADERRTNLHALAILQTMRCAGLDGDAQRELCRRAFDAFGVELGLCADDRRAVGNMWRGRRDALVSAALGRGDQAVHSTLVRRREQLGAWLDDDNQRRLRVHLRAVIHMSGTRLHFRHNRVEEAWAFFFARCLLDRWQHLPHEAADAGAWLC